jgi:soluble lytic murein transglycosylase-like protein
VGYNEWGIIMLGAVVLSPETLEPVINEMSNKYNVPAALIKATIKQESNWDVNASRFEAHKVDASWGLMQLLLVTARGVLGNKELTTTQLINPRVNIEAGTKFLSQLLDRFGNMRDAIAAYNAGSPRLNAQGKYVNQDYVDKVTKNYNLYKTMGTGVITEAAIDTAEVISNPDMLPVYIIVGLGAVGLIVISKSEG